jgi:hypothetical protein
MSDDLRDEENTPMIQNVDQNQEEYQAHVNALLDKLNEDFYKFLAAYTGGSVEQIKNELAEARAASDQDQST